MTEVETKFRLVEDPWERAWLILTLVVLAVFVGAIVISSVGFGIHLPGAHGRVDPKTVTTEGPFSQPGLRDEGGGRYTAYVVGRMWAWDPATITVPWGAEVTFRITSVDVQHGFKLAGTNVNGMAVPGQITELTTMFDQVGEFRFGADGGEYAFVCSEYCGIGHERMSGSVTVVPREAFEGVSG